MFLPTESGALPVGLIFNLEFFILKFENLESRAAQAVENYQPSEEEVAELSRMVAKSFVRRDGKFYSVENPNSPLNRKDVERISFHRFVDEQHGFVPNSQLLKQVYRRSIDELHLQRDQSIQTWLGNLRCSAGNPEKLLWNDGAVAINTWSLPRYRTREVAYPEMGPVQDFLEIFFEREEERDFFINWLAWCLQNEGDKPGWAPFFYSKMKGTGKSTLCKIVSKLFGDENTAVQNNVDKLTSRFNMTMLNSKLVISEELKLDPKDKARGNALKTFITEGETISEIKGREAERVKQCCCFLFTTNHIPLWIEAEDRRYWVVQADHDGHASGPLAAEFAELVGNVRAFIEFDEHLAGIYASLMTHKIPEDFDAKTLNVVKSATPIMKVIQSGSAKITLEMLDEDLNRRELNAIPQEQVVGIVTGDLKQSPEAAKHLLSELGWTKVKRKWGAIDYARALWVRPGYVVEGGKIAGPEGVSNSLADHIAQIENTVFKF